MATVAIIIAASAVTINAVRGGRAGDSRREIPDPIFREDWRQIVKAGELIGDANAEISIIEFSDLECPYCREFHSELRRFQETSKSSVSLSYVHFPLPSHRFAIPAAHASECSDQQGRFAEYVDLIFRKQDSLGLKSFWSYAKDAGVADSSQFARCLGATSARARIDSGRAVGSRLNVRGTPTILINGWQLPEPPHDSLETVVRRILKGEGPFRPNSRTAP